MKLYIWGYFNEVRSSRRLERECRRNVETMWLLRRLAPDFKTIADFRRDNGAAIVGACRTFVTLCRDMGLFQARLVALDGSKFRAVASSKKIMGQHEIGDEAARLDRRIADYLAGLDQTDNSELDDAPGATAAVIAALRARRSELDRLAAKLEEEGRTTVVGGEEDARPMGKGNGPKPPSYNVQTAVDADTGLIIHHEVTDEATDKRQLHPMAKATRDVLGRAELTVVADAGFANGAHASACEADALNRMNARADPELMAKRRCAAEHPFGTIKRMMAGGRFLTRNLKGTRTEMAFSVLAYNMLRAINIKAATA